jgi:tetratricopeptide (TPR) repeat protein
MKFPRLLSAEALPNFHLRVCFQDNTETIVDFREQLVAPVMRSIATPEAFARVRVAETGSYCYWDVDAPPTERPDASSDWLYVQQFSEDHRKEFEEHLARSADWQEAANTLLRTIGRGVATMCLCALLFACMGTGTVLAQTKVLDSLQNALTTAKEDTNKVNVLCSLAQEFYQKEPQKSLEFAEQALQLAQRLRNKRQESQALYYVGTSYYRLSNDVLAMQFCLRAKNIADSIRDNQLLAMITYRLGVIYNQQGNYEQGIVILRTALLLSERSQHKNFVRGAMSAISEAFIGMQRYDSALVYAEENWRYTQLGNVPPIVWGRNLETLGLVYFLLQRYDDALKTVQFAVQYDEGINNLTVYYAGNLIILGRVYGALQQYRRAIASIEKGLLLAQRQGFKNRIKEAYAALTEIYTAQRN